MFDVNGFINESKREYLELAIGRFPWVESAGHRWMFSEPLLDIVGKELFGIDQFEEGPYEIDNVMLQKGDIVMDVGANLGLFSAWACYKGCTTYAFEPLPYNIRHLELMKELNPNYDLHVEGCALSDTIGTMKLYSHGNDLGGGTIVDEIRDRFKVFNPNRPVIDTLVNVLTLDKFMECNDVARVDFIKADIEGSEIGLIKGARETIRKHKPKLSLCHYHRVTDADDLEKLITEIRSDYTVIKGAKKIYAY